MTTRTNSLWFIAFNAALWSGGVFAAEQSCGSGDVLFMAIEPVKELVGFNGETRAQYLDKWYPGWQQDSQQVIRGVAPTGDEAIRVSLTTPTGLTLERADVIVESAFDYVDRDNRRTQRVGHREIARYPLAVDVTSEIVVPKSALREPGAILVVVTVRRTDPAGALGAMVGVLPVEFSVCPRRAYTHDRFTAIRLNRDKAKSPPTQ